MPVPVARRDLVLGSAPPGPRLRVDRSAALTLSDSWQAVAFTGTSAENVNTFPGSPPLVEWDANLFRFHATADRNYVLTFFYRVTAGNAAATIQARLVVPNAITFPFPESVQRVDLCRVSAGEEWADFKEISVYANAALRGLGLGVEMKCTAGAAVLNECIAVIYGV